MDEIYIPIKDDGVDLKIGMSLDEADRMAKWIAAAVHKARTGESCDDVGFVFWHARGLMPPFGGWYLVSIKTKAGYRNTDVDPYDEDYEDFENYHADVLTGWAELPETTKSTETFQEYWVEFEEEERREQEALKKKRAAGAEDFGQWDDIQAAHDEISDADYDTDFYRDEA